MRRILYQKMATRFIFLTYINEASFGLIKTLEQIAKFLNLKWRQTISEVRDI